MEAAAVLVGAIGVLLLLWLFLGGRRTASETTDPMLPAGVRVTATPLLSERDLSLYNVICLAVQDHFLVLAQVPLWAFTSVEAAGQVRTRLLNRVALKRVDFVLVHPGSRQVTQVLQVVESASSPQQVERQRVIESVVRAAGIALVTLHSDHSYSAPEMAALLGLAPED